MDLIFLQYFPYMVLADPLELLRQQIPIPFGISPQRRLIQLFQYSPFVLLGMFSQFTAPGLILKPHNALQFVSLSPLAYPHLPRL